MKKLNLLLFVVFLFSLTPMPLSANTKEPISAPTNTPLAMETKAMVDRLAEIKAMDKSKLNRLEKKQLRKELQSMKRGINLNNGGVYLSVGSILIIILLLVLLL